MKVLLINPPLTYCKGSESVRKYFPIGLMYIAAMVRNVCQVEIFDCLAADFKTKKENVISYGNPLDEIRIAIEEKKPIIVRDIKERFSVDVEKNYNAILSIPLRLKDEIIGTINLYDSSVNSIKDEDLEFISVIADQVAIAVVNAQRFEQIKELAVVDKLTNVFNRRYFMELLENAVDEGVTISNPLGLILLDIDHFGKYNNTHGHPKGDELLKELSRILKENVRKGDIIGRYGGEEFILMLPKATPQIALEVATKVKDAVADYPFYGRETQPNGKVTISIGLVVCRANISLSQLIKETDEALYKAKNSGKNRIVQKVILSNNLKAEI